MPAILDKLRDGPFRSFNEEAKATKLIGNLLVFTSACLFAAFILACYTASMLNDSNSQRITGFVGMWTVLGLILACYLGFQVINKLKTKMSVGMMLGGIFIVCQQLLIVFAIFTERSQLIAPTMQGEKSSTGAMAAFTFLMFIGFSLAGMFLYMFRAHIIKVENFQVIDPINSNDNI